MTRRFSVLDTRAWGVSMDIEVEEEISEAIDDIVDAFRRGLDRLDETAIDELAVGAKHQAGDLIFTCLASDTVCEHCHCPGSDVRVRIPDDCNAVSVCDDCHHEWLDGRTLEQAIADERGESAKAAEKG